MNAEELPAQIEERKGRLASLAKSNADLQWFLDLADHHKQALAQRDVLIAEQKSIIEQLKRMLFGPKSEKLTPEQETELAEVAGDLQEQVARPGTDSQEVLTDETEVEQKQDQKPRRRRLVPVELEVITTVLEPADAGGGRL